MQLFPKALAKAEAQTNNFAHRQLIERLQLCGWEVGNKTQCTMVAGIGLQHPERQSYEDLRGRKREKFVCFVQGCDLHLGLFPAYALSTHVDFNRDICLVQLPAKDFDQSLISTCHPEGAISVDLFVSAQTLH